MSTEFLSWEDAVLWLKAQPDQQELVKACFYDDPLREAAERYFRSHEWQSVQALLQGSRPGPALDLGAGRGISSFALARDGWEVTALEPDPSEVVGAGAIRSLAAETGLNISVTESWGEALPFPDNFFTLVYARAVLHHSDNLDNFCREISRVLCTGGLVLATREHVIDTPADLSVFQSRHPLHRLYGGEQAFTLSRYLQAFANAGLRITKTLAPYSSDINLHPNTQENIRRKLAKKLHVPVPKAVFRTIVAPMLNRLLLEPGRLFTFFGVKP